MINSRKHEVERASIDNIKNVTNELKKFNINFNSSITRNLIYLLLILSQTSYWS